LFRHASYTVNLRFHHRVDRQQICVEPLEEGVDAPLDGCHDVKT
jgi:hypothetical protein